MAFIHSSDVESNWAQIQFKSQFPQTHQVLKRLENDNLWNSKAGAVSDIVWGNRKNSYYDSYGISPTRDNFLTARAGKLPFPIARDQFISDPAEHIETSIRQIKHDVVGDLDNALRFTVIRNSQGNTSLAVEILDEFQQASKWNILNKSNGKARVSSLRVNTTNDAEMAQTINSIASTYKSGEPVERMLEIATENLTVSENSFSSI